MPTLQQAIAKKFLEELDTRKVLDAPRIEAVRKLLQSDAKLKPDDFVKIFTTDGGEVA
jgi:hypothetical protein